MEIFWRLWFALLPFYRFCLYLLLCCTIGLQSSKPHHHHTWYGLFIYTNLWFELQLQFSCPVSLCFAKIKSLYSVLSALENESSFGYSSMTGTVQPRWWRHTHKDWCEILAVIFSTMSLLSLTAHRINSSTIKYAALFSADTGIRLQHWISCDSTVKKTKLCKSYSFFSAQLY